MFDRLADLVSEHAELEHALADPGVHSDQERARTLGRRYAELTPIVHAYTEWQQTSDDEHEQSDPDNRHFPLPPEPSIGEGSINDGRADRCQGLRWRPRRARLAWR